MKSAENNSAPVGRVDGSGIEIGMSGEPHWLAGIDQLDIDDSVVLLQSVPGVHYQITIRCKAGHSFSPGQVIKWANIQRLGVCHFGPTLRGKSPVQCPAN